MLRTPTGVARAARAVGALVLGLLLAVPVMLATAVPAHACSCAITGLGRQAEAADLVVSGTVLEVRRDGGAGQQGQGNQQGQQGQGNQQGQQGRGNQQRDQPDQPDEGRPQRPQRLPFGTATIVVGVDRIYAGRVPDSTIEITTSLDSASCGLGALPTEQRYFFFLTEDATTLRANSCGGSGPATPNQARAVTRVLGEGRPVDQVATPSAVERTVVGDPEVASLPLVAAPGGVLAAVGLIGLVVIGGLGRRSSSGS